MLSHNTKYVYPNAKVIWNDFDDYQERIREIPKTNELILKLAKLSRDLPSEGRLPDAIKKKVLELVRSYLDSFGYLDYISISANLLFSGNYAKSYEELEKFTLYNRIRKSEYHADGYLEGVERVKMDYKEAYARYQSNETIYMVDPPYMSTDVSSYNSAAYWRVKDHLDILNVLDNDNYLYFTSNKSQIVELCEWVETRTYKGNPFQNSTMTSTNNKVNSNAAYTDLMYYKYEENE